MAISLKQYDTRVAPKAGAVGVEGSVSLAMETAGEDQLVNAELLTGLGDAAVGYLEKKKEIKDTADSADYKTRLLRLQTDLESAKVKAIQDGVSYQNIYSEVYTPMLEQFRSDTINAGYSKDILTSALQNFNYDQEAIRQKELAEIERIDLANYTLKIQNGLKDHYAAYGFGINELEDEEFKNQLTAYEGIVGKEQASIFVETFMTEDALAKVAGIVDSSADDATKLAALDQVSDKDLTPDAAREVRVAVASAQDEIAASANEKYQAATTEVTKLMRADTFDFTAYNEIKNSLPPAQRELLDDHIIQIAELEKNYQIQNPELRDGEAVEIMDMVSRFATGESIKKRNAFQRFWTKDDEPLSYAEVFELGKSLSPEGQTVLYVAMKEAMQSKALNNTPIATYQEFNGLSPKGLFLGVLNLVSPVMSRRHPYFLYHNRRGILSPYETKETQITFNETGKDFLNELFLYSENIGNNDLMGWMKQTLMNFAEFKTEFPEPTVEQYQEFKAQNFTIAAANKINTVLSGSVGVTVTPEQMKTIDNAKGK